MMPSAERRGHAVGNGMTAVAIGAAALTLAACGGGGSPTSRTYTIHGTVTIVGEMPPTCRWAPGYMDDYWADLREGAEVVVKDLGGKVLTTAKLSAGKPSPPGVSCEWTYTARVGTAKFYTVTIPHGGDVVVSFSQLQKNDWSLRTSAS
jgi:hypothetical protein